MKLAPRKRQMLPEWAILPPIEERPSPRRLRSHRLLPLWMYSAPGTEAFVRSLGYESNIRWAASMAMEFRRFALKASPAKSIRIYRALGIPKFGAWSRWIKPQCLGTAWSFRPFGATVAFPPPYDDYRIVVMQGEVAPRFVEWQSSLELYIPMGHKEWELRLMNYAPILLHEVGEHAFYPPIRGNAGAGGSSWRDCT